MKERNWGYKRRWPNSVHSLPLCERVCCLAAVFYSDTPEHQSSESWLAFTILSPPAVAPSLPFFHPLPALFFGGSVDESPPGSVGKQLQLSGEDSALHPSDSASARIAA